MRQSEIARLAYGLAIAALLGAMPDAWTLRADSHAGRFDGSWIGEMQTTYNSGPCGRQYRLEFSISQGAVTGSASRAGERFTVYGEIGEVEEESVLTWTATSGRGSVDASGKMEGDAAHGEWEDSTGICAGVFSIEKAL